MVILFCFLFSFNMCHITRRATRIAALSFRITDSNHGLSSDSHHVVLNQNFSLLSHIRRHSCRDSLTNERIHCHLSVEENDACPLSKLRIARYILVSSAQVLCYAYVGIRWMKNPSNEGYHILYFVQAIHTTFTIWCGQYEIAIHHLLLPLHCPARLTVW